MYRFKSNEICCEDEEGYLLYLGAEWTEPDEIGLALVHGLVMLLVVGWPAGFLIIPEVFQGDWTLAVYMSIGLVGCTALVVVKGRDMSAKYRSLLFHADGRIEFPLGVPYRWRQRWLVGGIDDLHTFQAHQVHDRKKPQAEPTYDVRLYLKNGDMMMLSEGQCDWEAHKIVTLLTAAYRDMKDARASIAHPSLSGVVDGHPVELMVD